jgi:hypothetical protein
LTQRRTRSGSSTGSNCVRFIRIQQIMVHGGCLIQSRPRAPEGIQTRKKLIFSYFLKIKQIRVIPQVDSDRRLRICREGWGGPLRLCTRDPVALQAVGIQTAGGLCRKDPGEEAGRSRPDPADREEGIGALERIEEGGLTFPRFPIPTISSTHPRSHSIPTAPG